ncbi:hypothetical protein KOI35_44250 [Actinoplanes bogorensis]|uniref:Uncharacterized protein n=1 Tax=Paractinoplanes bogorensis TaxID=1610840 RepID=A0ABS5Z4D5_9ACTN|nr:hypothetical protein [Actinoplanes bogorensis]MBU2670535.1 hypothetical protein [Actinoplanes bogorensis]
MTLSRRTGWLLLAAAAAIALGGSIAARRRARPAGAEPASVSPPAGGPVRGADPSRSLVKMAIGAGIVVVLAILTVIVTRPSNRNATPTAAVAAIPYPSESGGGLPSRPPMSLADCQLTLAVNLNATDGMICGYETAGWDRVYDEPSADPNDPRYAGAALPVGMNTDGRICVAGSERPVLDTVRPTLSASFTPVPGLRYIKSTFQITGVYGRTAEDQLLPGDTLDPLKATLEFFRHGDLEHGESYRWRVRGTPPTIGAAGWSPWCEFTIPEKTPDDLGLDDNRTYSATLTAAEWKQVLAAYNVTEGNAAGKAAIGAAIKDGTAPVTLKGSDWVDLVNFLAWTASENRDQATWRLADLVSSAVGGPDPVTMGHERV